MATTMTTSNNMGGEDQVLTTAQQIVNDLNNAPKEVQQDMLLILSSFDNRLSNIMSLIDGDNASKSEEDRFALAEKVFLWWDPSSEGSRRSLNWENSSDEADKYLSAIDEILNLMDKLSVWSNSKIVDRAYSAIQQVMSQLEDEFWHVLIWNTVPLDARMYGSIRRSSLSFPVKYAGIIVGEDDMSVVVSGFSSGCG